MATRNKGIRIPVSETELQIIKNKAENENLSMATYLRNLGLKKQEDKNLTNFLEGRSSEELAKRDYDFYRLRAKKYTSENLKKEWYISDYETCYKLALEVLEKAIMKGYDISKWEGFPPIEEVI